MRKLVVIFLCGLLSTGAVYAQSGSDGSITWELVEGVFTVGGEGAFFDLSHVTTVSICGNTLVSTGEDAFSNCIALLSINLPASLFYIERNAFFIRDHYR